MVLRRFSLERDLSDACQSEWYNSLVRRCARSKALGLRLTEPDDVGLDDVGYEIAEMVGEGNDVFYGGG